MSEWCFYHLETSPIEAALPPLLERCLGVPWRAWVLDRDAERLSRLDQALWTFRDDAFLPHALAGEAADHRQPILLETMPDPALLRDQKPRNQASAIFVLDLSIIGVDSPWLRSDQDPGFARISLLFDSADAANLSAARNIWQDARRNNAQMRYFQQDEAGRWSQRRTET